MVNSLERMSKRTQRGMERLKLATGLRVEARRHGSGNRLKWQVCLGALKEDIGMKRIYIEEKGQQVGKGDNRLRNRWRQGPSQRQDDDEIPKYGGQNCK